jgi:DNA-binding protein HU-beta
MTQTQIIQTLADSCEISKKVAKSLLDSLAQTAVAEVKKNGLFVIPGIGRLVRVERKARMGRNPATGAAIKIAAKKVVKFRVAKAAKDAIVPLKAKKAKAWAFQNVDLAASADRFSGRPRRAGPPSGIMEVDSGAACPFATCVSDQQLEPGHGGTAATRLG